MLWESLVTDGHVRAARLRRLQPWLIAAALVLLWLGLWLARPRLDPRSSTSFAAKLSARLSDSRERAGRAFEALPRPSLPPDEVARLPPAEELPELVQALNASLADRGELPTGEVDFVEMDVPTFWAGGWAPESVAYVESGGTYLLGALVDAGSRSRPQPVRWLAAAREGEAGWRLASLATGGTWVPDDVPSVAPEQVSVSLAPLLPPLPPRPAGATGS